MQRPTTGPAKAGPEEGLSLLFFYAFLHYYAILLFL